MSMNTGTWRLRLDDPIVIGQKAQSGMTAGYVDLSTVAAPQKAHKRTAEQRNSTKKAAAKRGRRKRAKS